MDTDQYDVPQADRQLLAALRAQAPRTCLLLAEVLHAIDGMDPCPRRSALEVFALLPLLAMADSGFDASDDDEAQVRALIEGK